MGVTKNLIHYYALIIAFVGAMPTNSVSALSLANNTQNNSINTEATSTQVVLPPASNDKNNSNPIPLQEELFKEAQTTIQQLEEASKVPEETFDNKIYLYSYQPITSNTPQTQQPSSINIPYTNIWRQPTPPVGSRTLNTWYYPVKTGKDSFH